MLQGMPVLISAGVCPLRSRWKLSELAAAGCPGVFHRSVKYGAGRACVCQRIFQAGWQRISPLALQMACHPHRTSCCSLQLWLIQWGSSLGWDGRTIPIQTRSGTRRCASDLSDPAVLDASSVLPTHTSQTTSVYHVPPMKPVLLEALVVHARHARHQPSDHLRGHAMFVPKDTSIAG